MSSTENKFELSGLGLVLILSCLLILFLIINTIRTLIKTSLKSETFLSNPVKPSKELMQMVASDNQLPPLNNGNEFAISFWIYVESITDTADHKLVFLQSGNSGVDNVNFENSNLIVYIEKGTNKLKFKLKTANAESKKVRIIDINNPEITSGIDGKLEIKENKSEINLNEDNCFYSEYIISYLPLQKWVNIVMNVDNNVVSIFLDGDLLKTHNLSTSTSNGNDDCSDHELSNIIINKGGNIFVGTDNENKLNTFDGLLSKFQIFNYSITTDHVKSIYKQSPIKTSALNKFGIPLYGIRNPFYKVDEIVIPENKETL